MPSRLTSAVTITFIIGFAACQRSGATREAEALTGGNPARGSAAIFRYGCGGCHTIKGIANAVGKVGPPLTGLRNRTYVAGMLPNSAPNLTHWITHPKQVNPNTAMPTLGVTGPDATDIAAYLYSID
jgi:cytochrome c